MLYEIYFVSNILFNNFPGNLFLLLSDSTCAGGRGSKVVSFPWIGSDEEPIFSILFLKKLVSGVQWSVRSCHSSGGRVRHGTLPFHSQKNESLPWKRGRKVASVEYYRRCICAVELVVQWTPLVWSTAGIRFFVFSYASFAKKLCHQKCPPVGSFHL